VRLSATAVQHGKLSMPEEPTTRKANAPIKVYCLPAEKKAIEENARIAGKSTSAFLLAIGQGYRVSGVVDYERVRELAKINGDLGRLGGLLKLWLTNDKRTAEFGDATIRAVLSKIERHQDELASLMMRVISPKKKDSSQ
jgi:hypothetical protein